MRFLLAVSTFALAILCAACAQGGAPSQTGSSGITMYGTIDEGVTFRK
jgi:hypothetical protein